MSLAKHSATVERPLEMPSPVTWSDVWFSEEESLSTPVYARDKLPEGALLEGPALITQFDSTTLVPPRWSLRVDAAMNMIMERNNG